LLFQTLLSEPTKVNSLDVCQKTFKFSKKSRISDTDTLKTT